MKLPIVPYQKVFQPEENAISKGKDINCTNWAIINNTSLK